MIGLLVATAIVMSPEPILPGDQPATGQYGELQWERWAGGNKDAIMVTCPDPATMHWSYDTSAGNGKTVINYHVSCGG